MHRANLASRQQKMFCQIGAELLNLWGVGRIWRRVVKLIVRQANLASRNQSSSQINSVLVEFGV